MKPLRLLYPESCMLCQKPLHGAQEGICSVCQEHMNIVTHALRCKAPRYVQMLVCAQRYDGAVRTAMIDLKFNGKQQNIAPFARQMALAWDYHQMPLPDVVTAVPISVTRQHKRGFNQSEELAKWLTRRWKVPYLSTLRRMIFSKRQSELQPEQRWDNAKRAFRLRNSVDLSGKTVLLVDDIVTTSATASHCAKLLRDAGAARVWVLAACKA